MKRPYIRLATAVLISLPVIASADPMTDERARETHHGHGEFKEKYWDGNCKIEREAKKDGEYKENRECKGVNHSHREFKDEYWDGGCKVEREAKKDGKYKEKRECKGPKYGHYAPAQLYVPGSRPVIAEPKITIHGTIKVP